MGKRIVTVTCTILLVFSMLLSTTSAVPSKGNHNPSEKLTIDQKDGGHFVEYLNLSGSSIFPADELRWSINEIFPGIENTDNPINQSNIFEKVIIENSVWYWEVSIFVAQLNCTCHFTIIHQSDNPHPHETKIILYLGESNHFPVIEHIPLFQLPSETSDTFLNYAITWPISEVELNDGLNISMFRAEVCQYSGEACVSNSFIVELMYSVLNDGLYMIQIDQEDLQIGDGNWLFNIIFRDSYLRTSNLDSKVLTFDLHPPNVTIFGDQDTTEMNQTVYSIMVDDGYDSSHVAITWTLTNPDGDIRALFDSEIIDDYGAKISFNTSGNWSINLLAIDSVGHFTRVSHVVDVRNTNPVINIYSNVEINSDISFDVASEWYLDASTSVDTANDQENLIFQWYHDGSVIHTGENLSKNVISQPGYYEIILIVSDDDGAQDTLQLSFTLKQDSTTNEDVSFSPVILASISFIVILISLSLILTIKKNNGEFKLPKWKN